MRSFFNIVLQGPSALHGREKIGGDANMEAREKIACNISQLLIYNTSKSTHHVVKTAAVRHNKERNSLRSVASSCMDTDGTKNRLSLTTNRVSQYRTIASWKLREVLRVRCVLGMLRMG